MAVRTESFRVKGIEWWGDCGDILMHGFQADGESEQMRLMRTGPFIPPITFPPLSCVVTDKLRGSMLSSGLTGLDFVPVIKHKIVKLNWEEWDRTIEPEPWQLPEREPEDYILRRRHAPR